MNRHIAIIIILFLTSFFNCQVPVTFTQPQPTEINNLSRLPNRVQGQYVSLADNSTLTVSDKLIKRTKDFDYKFHKNQLDSNQIISGNTLTDTETNKKYLIKKVGDSLLYHAHETDTLFKISSDNVVKKFKGYYFLNRLYDKESWEVKKLSISKGQLTISSISTEYDLESLKEITETPQDTMLPYRFIATKKQFKEIIKSVGFSDNEVFVRLKKYGR